MSYDNPRIKHLNYTIQELIILLSDRNIDAVNVLIESVRDGAKIDPDSAFAELSVIFALDTLDCYGPDIWLFYKDLCGQNLNYMIGLLRANQLGFISSENLLTEIKAHRTRQHKTSLDVLGLCLKVKEKLPNFNLKGAL